MDLEKIKKEIADIASRPNGVEFSEIDRIVRHLGTIGYRVSSRAGTHLHLFVVGSERFTVCKHNPKRKELKSVYVRNFLTTMTALELYDPHPEPSRKEPA